MCAFEFVVDIFSAFYSDRELFWLEILDLASRTSGADHCQTSVLSLEPT